MLVNQYNSNKFNASYYTAQAYVINKVSIVHHKLSYLYIFWLANNNFIIDQIYAYHASLVLKICNIIYNLFDKGVLEKFGPTGLDKLIIYISKKYKKFTNKNFSIVNIIITFYLIMFFVILFIAVIL